jgi:hypothetical protein
MPLFKFVEGYNTKLILGREACVFLSSFYSIFKKHPALILLFIFVGKSS